VVVAAARRPWAGPGNRRSVARCGSPADRIGRRGDEARPATCFQPPRSGL